MKDTRRRHIEKYDIRLNKWMMLDVKLHRGIQEALCLPVNEN